MKKVSRKFVKVLLESEHDGVYVLDPFHLFQDGTFKISRLGFTRSCRVPRWLWLLNDDGSRIITGKYKISKSRRPVAFVRDIDEYANFRKRSNRRKEPVLRFL